VHTISVPLHNQLKTGMLHSILSEVAQAKAITIESITELLWQSFARLGVSIFCLGRAPGLDELLVCRS
jgi:hypothetical protein